MRRTKFWIAVWISIALSQHGNLRAGNSTIEQRIQVLLAQSPTIALAHVGYKFVDLAQDRTLAEHQPESFFTPASNTKLYTVACALVRLGPGYRFKTEVQTSGDWQPGEADLKDVLLVGGGDPSFSGRTLPYGAEAVEGDGLAGLRNFADQLWAQGVRRVLGNVEVVGARYLGDPYPDGWTIDDSTYDYGAPVSSLVLDDNTEGLTLRPGELGGIAQIELRPPTRHFLVSNEVATVSGREAHISVTRPDFENEMVLRGTLGQDVSSWHADLAVEDPELWAAEAFVSVLEERGISVLGKPMTRRRACGCKVLASRTSLPLAQLIQTVNKVSQNLHAELLLREVAVAKGAQGTLENGWKERQLFLQEAGLSAQDTALSDGSGLARQNLTSADATVKLLRYMWRRPEWDAWLQSLPVGGFDGSLQSRFRQKAGAQRVHGKTGSLAHVTALSGYIEKRDGGWIAFSVMINAAAGKAADLRNFTDSLCAVFLE